jgi:hypothetical protein
MRFAMIMATTSLIFSLILLLPGCGTDDKTTAASSEATPAAKLNRAKPGRPLFIADFDMRPGRPARDLDELELFNNPDWQKLLQAVKDAELVLEVPDLNDKVMFGDATLSMFPLDYPENQEIAGMLIGCRRPIGGPFNTQCCVFFAGPPLVCKVKK